MNQGQGDGVSVCVLGGGGKFRQYSESSENVQEKLPKVDSSV